MAGWLGEQAPQTEQERERYRFEAHEARARRTGLWQDAEPLPPWECVSRRSELPLVGTPQEKDFSRFFS